MYKIIKFLVRHNIYLYRDPYVTQYGFYFNWEPEAYLRFGVRFWKYDLYYSKTGRKLDYVKNHFERMLRQANKNEKESRIFLEKATKENKELKDKLEACAPKID